MRPVQPTLTTPYAVRFDCRPCDDELHRGCVTVTLVPSLTPDGLFPGALASMYEHCTPGEALDVIDVYLMYLDRAAEV